MGFKLKTKQKGTEVKIYKSDVPELIGQFGVIIKNSLTTGLSTIKLTSTGEIVEIPTKDLIIP